MYVDEIKDFLKEKGFRLLKGTNFLGKSGITTLIHEETKTMCVIKDEISKYNIYVYPHNPVFKTYKEQYTHGNPIKSYRLMDFVKLLKYENSVSDFILNQ